MGDQKTGKNLRADKTPNSKGQKNSEKSQSNTRLETNQRLAYPRLRQEAEHKSLGGSPEKTAKKTRMQLYSHKILLLYPAITCELANPRSILRRRFNPRQVSFFMFNANGQAPVRVVQCLLIYKPNRVRSSYPHLG